MAAAWAAAAACFCDFDAPRNGEIEGAATWMLSVDVDSAGGDTYPAPIATAAGAEGTSVLVGGVTTPTPSGIAISGIK